MMPTKEDDLNLINNNINTNNNHISNPISTMNNNNGPTSNFCGNDSVDLNNMNNNNNNNNDNGNTRIQNTTGMSKAELRKVRKNYQENIFKINTKFPMFINNILIHFVLLLQTIF